MSNGKGSGRRPAAVDDAKVADDQLESFRAWVRAIWLADSTPEAATGWNLANEVVRLRAAAAQPGEREHGER